MKSVLTVVFLVFFLNSNYSQVCLPGQFDNNGVCEACLPGFYQPDGGQTSCIPCEKGTYSDSPESQECVPCAEGTYADNMATENCTPCAAGYTSPVGSMSLSDCVLKNPAGSIEINGKLTVGSMLKTNYADSLVVRRSDGSLGIREVSSLPDIDDNAGWTMVEDTIVTNKSVDLSGNLKVNNQNYVEAASFGITAASRADIINDISENVDFKYIFGDTTLFEPIHTGTFGVKIKKSGIIWASSHFALITSSDAGYTSLIIYKNGSRTNSALISGTNNSWDGLDFSVPIVVSKDDIITIRVVEAGSTITNISAIDDFVNFNFLWFSN